MSAQPQPYRRMFTPEERASYLGWRYGSTLDWNSLILAEIGYPAENRWFVDAVQGICKGKECRIAHSTLAKRAQRFKNKPQARELAKRAIEFDREWARSSLRMIFDIESPKPNEMEGKDKRARTKYTDYLTAAGVWAQGTEHKVKKSDEVRWKRDRKYRLEKREEIMAEAIKMLPGFERPEDMPPGVSKKGPQPLSLSEYVDQREKILLAENRRVIDRICEGDLLDADEIDARLAALEVFHKNAALEIENRYRSAREVLKGLKETKFTRAINFTDVEEAVAPVDEILARKGNVHIPPTSLSAAVGENSTQKGNVDVTPTCPDAPAAESHTQKGNVGIPPTCSTQAGQEGADTPNTTWVTNSYKGNAHIPLSSLESGEVKNPQTSETEPDMLEWALFWAEQGIPVFPVHSVFDGICSCSKGSECTSPGKHPLSRLVHNGCKDATTDPEIIRRWWKAEPHANIGGVMGGERRYLGLDADPRAGGDASYHDLIEAHGSAGMKTLHNRSGGQGFHKLFTVPEGVSFRKAQLAPGIDVKWNGGYLIMPPSIHVSGRRYELIDPYEIQPAPQWIIDELVRRPDQQPARVIDFQEQKHRLSVDESQEKFYEHGDPGRNKGLFRVGIGRWRHGWAQNADELYPQLVEINLTRCVPPLADDELMKVFESITERYAHEKGVDAVNVQRAGGSV